MRKKVLVVLGTRPEAIKMAPVIKELDSRRDAFEVKVCLTAQHREMLDQVVELFGFRVDYDLDIMRERQTLASLTSNIIQGMQPVLDDAKPDVVLVHGDTTTTFSTALSCYYSKIKVGHVEAGLRTYNKFSPFPEELNRKLVAGLADYHFAPTTRAQDALLDEGVAAQDIVVTGNTVIDALFLVLKKIEKGGLDLGDAPGLLEEHQKIVLITGHRRESFGEGFENICQAIYQLSQQFKDHSFIYPVHLNPNIQEPVNRILGSSDNIILLPPMDYAPFVLLMDASRLVLTDSGGIQEEAPSLGKPVLVMRELTERPEAMEAGTAMLVGTDTKVIIEKASTLLSDEDAWREMSRKQNPYGDGLASKRIAEHLE